MRDALGTIDKPEDIEGNQRKDCSCYGSTRDALAYNSSCASSCVYCYAKHNNDSVAKYYDNDGKLLDNPLTRINKREGVEKKLSQAPAQN
jgi:pyruvate formate-lyase activating enzyme-like uncharacterized protein